MRKSLALRHALPIVAVLAAASVAHVYLLAPSATADETGRPPPPVVTIIGGGVAGRQLGTLEVVPRTPRPVAVVQSAPAAKSSVRLPFGLCNLPRLIGGAVWRPGETATGRSLLTAVADAANIVIDHVWARPTFGAGTTSAAYLTITNQGAADQLVGASTPIATAGLHETIADNGVMKMRPVAAIPLEPGQPVTFRPGGYHVMLEGLKAPLKAGDSFPLTLSFAHAQPITVTVKVGPASGTAMQHGGMPGMPAMH